MAIGQGSLEGVVNADFWRGRKVLLTGHTGFKGGWLALWLHRLGADLTGYSLPPPTEPSLFVEAGVGTIVSTMTGDVRDLGSVIDAVRRTRPEVVFHLAAQPLVRHSYRDPVGTYATNVMGVVHLLEAVRSCDSVRSIVVVTSDKCYENREQLSGYNEDDPMGGSDPYSSSKGCAELVTSAYRQSFFHPQDHRAHGVALATVRAGNVIGGGDWAEDRLIPDFIRAVARGEELSIRLPNAVRPWQHVLEPVCGYISLAERLVREGPVYGEAWNFGPGDYDARSVAWLVEKLASLWGGGARWRVDNQAQPHETHYLKLDSSKAQARLNWTPRWPLAEGLSRVVDWHQAHLAGRDMRTFTIAQIESYERAGV